MFPWAALEFSLSANGPITGRFLERNKHESKDTF